MKIDDTKRLFLGQVASGIISLIATIWIARYVGAEVFGSCASLILAASVVLDVIDFGCCSWAARELASNRIDKFQYKVIMKSKVGIASSLILTSPIFYVFLPSDYKMLSLVIFYPGLWLCTKYIQQYLISLSQIKSAIYLQLTERCCWFLYIPFSLLEIEKTTSYVLPILVGLLLHGIFGMKCINANMRFESDLKSTSHKINFGISVTRNFGITSVVSDTANLDSVLVAKLASFSEAGNYTLASRFRNPALLSFQIIATRLRPIAARRNTDDIRTFFKENKFFNISGALLILVTSILCLTPLVDVFGKSFEELNKVLALGILTALPSGVGILSSSLLNSINFESFVAKITALYTLSSLIGIGIAALQYGSMGAVVFNFVQASLFACILFIKSRREFKKL